MRKQRVRRIAVGLVLGVLGLLVEDSALSRDAFARPRAASFKQSLPGRRFVFPRDHAAHPDYQTEWWYYTGQLQSRDGRRFGYQITFFRVGVIPPGSLQLTKGASQSRWALKTIYFAHLALTDKNRKTYRFEERASRGALGLAGARESRYDVWIDDWRAWLEGQTHHIVAETEDFGLQLILTPVKPPAIHGEEGVSQKGEGRGRASYYYSFTRLNTQGRLRVGKKSLDVSGLSWMDHEFSSNSLAPTQVGWDWFSIQLDNGEELMLYLLRHKDGSIDPYSSGTLVQADGKTRHLRRSEFSVDVLDHWRSKKSGARYPSRWRVQVPALGIDLQVAPSVADQELVTHTIGVTYWEGAVEMRGKVSGLSVRGEGYVELTGYAGRPLGETPL